MAILSPSDIFVRSETAISEGGRRVW